MKTHITFVRRSFCALIAGLLIGCDSETQSYPLDKELARASVKRAMQAWVDGKQPKDLKPDVIVGDSGWEAGKKLLSFEILPEEFTDGSNLHITVIRKFDGGGKSGESKVTYIVGTSPVVTIFPQ